MDVIFVMVVVGYASFPWSVPPTLVVAVGLDFHLLFLGFVRGIPLGCFSWLLVAHWAVALELIECGCKKF